MALYDVKPKFRELLRPLVWRLTWLHPDVLTWGALVCSAAAAILLFYAGERRWIFLVVPGLLFVRIALNAMDGLLAQATGKARPFGEVLNEATDRLSDIAILLGVAFSPFASPRWGAAAIAAVALLSLLCFKEHESCKMRTLPRGHHFRVVRLPMDGLSLGSSTPIVSVGLGSPRDGAYRTQQHAGACRKPRAGNLHES